jgi:hypothetical protein
VEQGPAQHRVRGRPLCLGVAEPGPMPDRTPQRRTLAPQQALRRAAVLDRKDPAHGVGPANESDPHPGPSPGGSPAPLPVLRAPAAAAIPRSAPRRSTATGPILVQRERGPRRSRRAPHGVSAAPGTPAGADQLQVVPKIEPRVELQVALQAPRPLTGPIVRRLPIGLNKRALAKRAAEKDVAVLREVEGPAAPGQLDSTHPGPTVPRPTVQELTVPGSPSQHGRSRGQPGPRQPGQPPRRVRTGVQNPDRTTTARALPAMPGRGESPA